MVEKIAPFSVVRLKMPGFDYVGAMHLYLCKKWPRHVGLPGVPPFWLKSPRMIPSFLESLVYYVYVSPPSNFGFTPHQNLKIVVVTCVIKRYPSEKAWKNHALSTHARK